jgi:hypothetical protein
MTSLKDSQAKTTMTIDTVDARNKQMLQQVEPAEALSEIQIDNNPYHVVQIGQHMTEKHRE